MMIEDFLRSHADRLGDKVAIARGDETITYAALYRRVRAEAERLAAQCRAANVAPHALPVTMRSSQSIDFLVSYFAAHVAGRPFVPLEKDLSDERFYEIRNVLGSASLPKGVADILFTSGTTGKPKGVMLSHRAIVANGDNLIQAQGYSTDLAFVVSGSLCHIGSLSKVWSTIMMGATLVLTDGMKDIERFFAALNYPCPKIATFLVPASIRMLLRFAPERLAAYAGTIDFVETGAAPMSLDDMQRLCATLPHSRLYNTYASTETGIIATHDYNTPTGNILGCLGHPMKHSSIAIGEGGRIVCQGKTLMLGYVGINSLLLTPRSSLPTNDLGYIDQYGRLMLQGRIDDIINVGGFKVSPIEVENASMRFPSMADCICVSASHPILGNVLKLIYATTDGAPIAKSALVVHLRKELEAYKVPLAYEQVDAVARNSNGKLDRKYYNEM